MVRRSSRPRRRRILSIQVLPTLVTSANLLAGLLAISYLLDAAGADDVAVRNAFVVRAAWMVFLGMFFDVLDGRIARMTNTTSEFGAQLDSLADVVTFGVAPALIARTVLGHAFPAIAGKLLVAIAVLYLLGAALRLARYNVESARLAAGGTEHVTKVFRGLPSPAAAGVIASLVILHHEYMLTWVEWFLLFMTPLMGLAMVSRWPYVHMMNRYVEGRRPIGAVVFIMLVIFAGVLYFHETVAVTFALYALSGPLVTLTYALFGWPKFAVHEDGDEESPLFDEEPSDLYDQPEDPDAPTLSIRPDDAHRSG